MKLSVLFTESIKYGLGCLFVWLCLVAPVEFAQTGLIWTIWAVSVGVIIYSFCILASGENLFEIIAKGDIRDSLESITKESILVCAVAGLVVGYMLYVYEFERTTYVYIIATIGAICASMKFLSIKTKINGITHDMHLHHLLNRWNEGDYLYVANKVEHLDKKKAITFFNKVIKYNGVKDGEILLKLIDD